MAQIALKEIAHTYISNPKDESDYALKRIHTEWEDGGAYALLGPSRCGKTTLLKAVMGLIKPSGGRILLEGRVTTGKAPARSMMAISVASSAVKSPVI